MAHKAAGERQAAAREHDRLEQMMQINAIGEELKKTQSSRAHNINILAGNVAGLPLGEGHKAIVRQLKSRDELNGTEVKLLHYVEAKERWAVERDCGERLLLKPANLYRGISASASTEDKLAAAIDASFDEAKAKKFVKLPETASQAAYRGNLTAVLKYLRKGDVNARCVSKMNRTLLHEAVNATNPTIVDLLLSKRADPNLASVLGSTPLHQAAAAGLDDMCRKLIAAGADVNLRTADGKSTASAPRAAGHTAILQMLVDAGLDESEPVVAIV